MKLLDSPSNRHIVQIFNADETQLQTTVLAIPNYRLEPTGKTQFQFWETPPGQPKALRAWFYPGDNFGQEFAYPKSAATRSPRMQRPTVPTTYAQSEADLTTANVGTVDAKGTEGNAGADEPAQTAQNTPAPAQDATPRSTPAPEADAHACSDPGRRSCRDPG